MQDNQNEELKYVSLSEMLKFFQDFGSYDDIQDKTCNTVFEIIETPKRNDVAYENIEKMDGKNFSYLRYMFFYQFLMTPATLAGYLSEIFKRKRVWK